MAKKSTRNLVGILMVLGILCLVSTLLLAEDYNFAGTWKGETGGAAQAPAGAPGGAGRGGASAGRGGGGGFGGPQKITLRVSSVNKEKGTAKGNFTMGSAQTEDIREAKIAGNKLTFKTGLPPAQIYDYEAVFIGDELTVTRTSSGGRGGGFPTTFKLARNK